MTNTTEREALEVEEKWKNIIISLRWHYDNSISKGNFIPKEMHYLIVEAEKLLKDDALAQSQKVAKPVGVVNGDSSDSNGENFWIFHPNDQWNGDLFKDYPVYTAPPSADLLVEALRKIFELDQRKVTFANNVKDIAHKAIATYSKSIAK